MARLDTGWHANPKVLRLSAAGMALHAWSISYCDAGRTDGVIPHGAWPSKLSGGVKELQRAGLWESAGVDYLLHDYLDYNRSRAQIEADQASARERMRDVRANTRRTNGESLARAGVPGPGPGDGLRPSYTGPLPLTPSPNPDGGPDEAAPRAASSHPRSVADALATLYGPPPSSPERLPNGAQQCPLCPDIFTGTYAEHLESPRHKVHEQPADLSGFRP